MTLAQADRRDWPLLALLLVLLCGPLLAPLFQATGLPLVADSGALARDVLARYVCPTPAKSYELLGFPMAVCARCWGATIGLWAAYLLYRRSQIGRPPMAERAGATGRAILHPSSILARVGRRWLVASLALPWPLRLALAAAPFLLWPLEIVAWPSAPLALLLLNGAQAGLLGGWWLFSARG